MRGSLFRLKITFLNRPTKKSTFLCPFVPVWGILVPQLQLFICRKTWTKRFFILYYCIRHILLIIYLNITKLKTIIMYFPRQVFSIERPEQARQSCRQIMLFRDVLKKYWFFNRILNKIYLTILRNKMNW